ERQGHASHPPLMAELFQLAARLDVPEANGLIQPAGDHEAAVRRERHPVHLIGMFQEAAAGAASPIPGLAASGWERERLRKRDRQDEAMANRLRLSHFTLQINNSVLCPRLRGHVPSGRETLGSTLGWPAHVSVGMSPAGRTMPMKTGAGL